jgi:hypothetical protein
MHAVGQSRTAAAVDGVGEAGHELVGAIRNDECELEIARPRQEGCAQIALEPDLGNGRFDPFGRGGAHAGAAIEDAVHGGQRDAGGPRDIMYRSPASQTDFVHTGSPHLR